MKLRAAFAMVLGANLCALIAGGALLVPDHAAAQAGSSAVDSQATIIILNACTIMQTSIDSLYGFGVGGTTTSVDGSGNGETTINVTYSSSVATGVTLSADNGGLALIDPDDPNLGCVFVPNGGEIGCTSGGFDLIVNVLSATSAIDPQPVIYRWANNDCRGPTEPGGPTPHDCNTVSNPNFKGPIGPPFPGEFCRREGIGGPNPFPYFFALAFTFPLNLSSYGPVTIVLEEVVIFTP